MKMAKEHCCKTVPETILRVTDISKTRDTINQVIS
jgi:hypothetical protein